MTPRSNNENRHSRISNAAFSPLRRSSSEASDPRHWREAAHHRPSGWPSKALAKEGALRGGGHKSPPAFNEHRLRRDNSDRDISQAKKEITAGVIVFRRSSEGLKYLLLYHRGQYWNFPKGHVEKEERSLDAAIRETTEETGLKRSDLRIVPGFKEYERFYFKKSKETIFKIVIIYLAETREPRIKISYEHQGYAWFLYREARQIVGRYKENQKVLERAHRFITERRK